ncbi:hypothetical protein [Micromonospora sp. NBC_01638]|uniref:hypothetical protein n=1 Tax=Micromonospora sp. NBC_01638 TaxID=2975982 RepID=UPI0038682183|nr:hypothetical protein OG811_01685 [Micromonospora sp. NBC_01638]
MTLYGWDTSDYDVGRGLTRARVAAASGLGIDFLTSKGTEQSPSSIFKSKSCGWVLAAGRDAGIPYLGAYVVVRSGVPAATQAQTLIAYADAELPWWRTWPGFFWQIDLERWPYDSVAPALGVQVGNELEARTTKAVLMYASKGQYGASQLGHFPRWNANYPHNRDEDFKPAYTRAGGDTGPGWQAYGTPSAVPRIWQYTSTARIGAQHTCDANAFRGTDTDFAVMIGATSVGGTDVQTVSIVTIFPGFTIPADGAFHAIRWSDGNAAYRITAAGLIGHQSKIDLVGLHEHDLVRLRAVYTSPGNPTPTVQMLNQQVVAVDPLLIGGGYVTISANENHRVSAGTTVTFEVAVTPVLNTGGRSLSFGTATRKSVLLFS